MDSRRDFTSKKVFSGYFSELGEKANSALVGPKGFRLRIATPPPEGPEVAYVARCTVTPRCFFALGIDTQ